MLCGFGAIKDEALYKYEGVHALLTQMWLSCSLAIGICNLLVGRDPVFEGPARKAAKVVTMAKLMEQIWKMMTIPTFALIIVQVAFCPHAHHVTWLTGRFSLCHAWLYKMPCTQQLLFVQGIVGSIPWTALVFFTLYLQLLGMTDFAASLLMSVFLGSTGQHRPSHLVHRAL